MHHDNLDYTAIRRRVEAEVQRERRRGQIALFFVNCLVFFVFMMVTWVLVPNTSSSFTVTDDVLAALMMLSIGWTTGLLMHGLTAFGLSSTDWADRRRRRLMVREIEYARLGLDDELPDAPAEKAKRGTLRLNDEGELLDIIEDEYAGDAARRQRQA